MGLINSEKNSLPTLNEYVNGWEDSAGFHQGWLNKTAKLSLKRSTRLGYQNILKNHLLSEFGSKRLDEITSRLIGDFIYKLFKEGLRSGTIRNIKNCLSAILRHASYQDGYIESNPARGVKVPKPEDETPLREPEPLSWTDRDHLEGVFQNNFPLAYPLVVWGFRTGLRIGELFALKWEDIDFHNRQIYVQRNIVQGKITTPKSYASRRHVRMTTHFIEVLKDHRRKMKEKKLKKGWSEVSNWVFCNEEGGFLNYGNFLNRIWNKAIEKSELRRRTPHDMRHTYATLRLSKGDSLAEVSKEMGHSSPNLTFSTYYKWMPKESRSDIDELDGKSGKSTTKRNLSATKMKKELSNVA